MGRWISTDLVNITEGRLMNPSSTLNKYAYSANNPLKYVDPDGQDITYFYDAGGVAGHAILFAFNQATGDSAIESFGPAGKSLLYHLGEIFVPVPGMSMFDMKDVTSADYLRNTYSIITIQVSPEITQQVIDFIKANPDPEFWDVVYPNCSSQVWRILQKFKLDNQHSILNQGISPKALWWNLYTQHVGPNVPNPRAGQDYGNPRLGYDMFNVMWLSLPQSYPHRERVTVRLIPERTQPVLDDTMHTF
jgi:hypothetical protein